MEKSVSNWLRALATTAPGLKYQTNIFGTLAYSIDDKLQSHHY